MTRVASRRLGPLTVAFRGRQNGWFVKNVDINVKVYGGLLKFIVLSALFPVKVHSDRLTRLRQRSL